MKTKPRKTLVLLLAAALLLCLAGCGGDDFESVAARSEKALEDIESVHADLSLNMDMSLDILGEQLDMDMVIAMSMDTAGALNSGTLNVSALDQSLSMDYVLTVDGESCDLYMSQDGGGSWEALRGIGLDELGSYGLTDPDAAGMANFSLESSGSFGEAVSEQLDGRDCLRFDGVLPGSSLSEAMSLSGGTEYAELVPVGETPADSPMSVWFYADSGLPARIWIDMTDAMGAYMAGMAETEGLEEGMFEISANAITVEVSFDGYNETAPASVPEV